jgi:epoxyqueuosine reductase
MSDSPPLDLAAQVKSLAKTIGYTACGITSAAPFEEYGRAIDDMIEQLPETRDLYEGMRRRIDPTRTAAWAKSVIVCARRYGKYDVPQCAVGHIGRHYLGDNRYPDCPDHGMRKRMRDGLKELGMRVKIGGVPDRWASARAGIARIARNGFVYSEHGSWINIETWRVDAELPHDAPATGPPCPEGCTACMDACPTQAIVAPFIMRMDRCIAYLTYEAEEPLDAELERKIGGWIYGCDVCQDVCPLNSGKWEPIEKADWIYEVAAHLTPEALAEMDQETYETVIHPRFWYIPKEDLARWHRNARRALENQ